MQIMRLGGSVFDANQHSSVDTSFEYLDPAGFAVDLYSTPHNDISQQSYVPVQRPWVDARGAWRTLSNPALGQVRQSESGTVLHYSAGTSGTGYAVCLHCGRTEPMPADSNYYPEVFQDRKTGQFKEHRRLRGAEGGETAVCTGSHSSFAIKRDLRLGHESSTDVLEIMLHGLDGKPLNDVSVAYSIAVAVRSAIAVTLGIEIDELGCETKPVQILGSQSGQAIVIYDHSAAGYSSSIADRIDGVLRMAHDALDCSASCPDACQHCLLQYDTRYRLHDLNRHAALAFLGGPWLSSLDLPDDQKCLGKNSRAEWQSLPEAISREATRAGARSIRLYFLGDNEDWDLPASPAKWHLRRWIDKPLELVATAQALVDLPESEHAALASLLAMDSVSLMAMESAPKIGSKFAALAEVIFEDGRSIAWATKQAATGIPNMQWAQLAPGQQLIVGDSPQRLVATRSIMLAPLPLRAQVARLDITTELDGNVQGFGERFLDAVWHSFGRAPIGEAKITGVTYSDRYIKNPLALALLLETVSALKGRYTDQWEPAFIRLIAMAPDAAVQPFPPATSVSHDWNTASGLVDAARAAFDYCGMDLQVVLASKYDSPHARSLEVFLSNDSVLRISLDQGFSCWKAKRRSRDETQRGYFSFADSATAQGNSIATLSLKIEGPSHGTYALIDLKGHLLSGSAS